MNAPRRFVRSVSALRAGGIVAGVGWLAWSLSRPEPAIAVIEPVAIEEPASVEPIAEAAIGDCETLALQTDPADAALMPLLCPGHPLSLAQALAALGYAATPAQAAALAPALAQHPELRAWADLMAGTSVTRPAELPDPTEAIVTPVDDGVLAWARLAERSLVEEDVDHDARTRARALLAKIHLQVLPRLGVAPGRMPSPFARRMTALALHHGRHFCQTYWQRRVAGLQGLFEQTEVQLSYAQEAIAAAPFHGDDVLLAEEREATHAYLSGSGARARIATKRGDGWSGPADAIGDTIERLVAQGRFDLAVERAVAVASRGADGPGLATLEQLLVDAARRHDRPEAPARLADRLARVRSQASAPPESGAGAVTAAHWPWPSAETIASEAAQWLARGHDRDGLARQHATARAILLLRDRPDAIRRLLQLSQTAEASAPVRDASTLVAAELAAYESDRASDLASWSIAHAALDPDRAARLRFAADLVR